MSDKTLAEQLLPIVKAGPWPHAELSECKEKLEGVFHIHGDNYLFDPERECPKFINWALDELAKKDKSVALGTNERDGGWVVLLDTGEWEFPHPTKTLALAHALVEVCGDLEEKNG